MPNRVGVFDTAVQRARLEVGGECCRGIGEAGIYMIKK